ncbi:YjbF family lipoprotein [Halomonas organivorans]
MCVLSGLLGGCASSGKTPLGASVAALWPDRSEAQVRATELPYASLSARLGDVQGLLVMGAQAGDVSYWPARDGLVLELWQGGLHAVRGLETDLLGSEYSPGPPWREAAPYAFRLVRHLSDASGIIRRVQAEGRMRCAPPERLALPLGERRLERCELILSWAGGETTSATLWRDPDTRHPWAVETTPWPGAPELEWQVARHWW